MSWFFKADIRTGCWIRFSKLEHRECNGESIVAMVQNNSEISSRQVLLLFMTARPLLKEGSLSQFFSQLPPSPWGSPPRAISLVSLGVKAMRFGQSRWLLFNFICRVKKRGLFYFQHSNYFSVPNVHAQYLLVIHHNFISLCSSHFIYSSLGISSVPMFTIAYCLGCQNIHPISLLGSTSIYPTVYWTTSPGCFVAKMDIFLFLYQSALSPAFSLYFGRQITTSTVV